MSRKECLVHRRDERHLFACPECRAEVRLAQAWKSFARSETFETEAPMEERFVERCADALAWDRRNRFRRRAWIAAAAALLFFFFAGLAHEQASRKPAVGTAEDSWAQLASPNSLDELIPN